MSEINIRSLATLKEAANELAIELVADNSVKAHQTEKENAVKIRFKKSIDDRKKVILSLKGKIFRYINKHAKALFDGRESGTIATNMATLSLAKNPPAIEQIDSKASEEALAAHARALGFPEVVVTTETINKEVLATLSNDDLEAIGYVKKQGKTLTFKVTADEKLKLSGKAS